MFVNALPECRHRLGWSQKKLAGRSGLSRTEISAIETGRVVPSTAAALSLAQVLDCSVEELFSLGELSRQNVQWAWAPSQSRGRFWQARVRDKRLMFPAEWTLVGTLGHDGVHGESGISLTHPSDPKKTLVIAGCDPAVGLLAARVSEMSDFRVIPLMRSSRRAVELLAEGLVHAAGLHFSDETTQAENHTAARTFLEQEFRLLRVARWEEGVAVDPSLKVGSVRAVLASDIRWVGREEGSAARQCLDQILGRRRRPDGYQYHALDHHGVTETICSGWAQAGVCVRLPAEERGLGFLKVREESYDLCFPAVAEAEPVIQTLLAAVRSTLYRRHLGQLPGYKTDTTGELQ